MLLFLYNLYLSQYLPKLIKILIYNEYVPMLTCTHNPGIAPESHLLFNSLFPKFIFKFNLL